MKKTHKLLAVYHKKRDFKKTPEPSGKKPAAKLKKKEPLFVIQKHAATRLHYDFRLEMEGVLKSWAVPKGPSLNPADKRLAMPTEDHPMDYARFEGVIPQGNYGAGNVIVWDFGTYVNLCHDPKTKKIIPAEEGWRRGHINVWLKGKKLQGAFVLTRMKGREGESKVPWLLIKAKDGAEDVKTDLTADRPESVFSGATIESISRKRGVKTWSRKNAE